MYATSLDRQAARDFNLDGDGDGDGDEGSGGGGVGGDSGGGGGSAAEGDGASGTSGASGTGGAGGAKLTRSDYMRYVLDEFDGYAQSYDGSRAAVKYAVPLWRHTAVFCSTL